MVTFHLTHGPKQSKWVPNVYTSYSLQVHHNKKKKISISPNIFEYKFQFIKLHMISRRYFKLCLIFDYCSIMIFFLSMTKREKYAYIISVVGVWKFKREGENQNYSKPVDHPKLCCRPVLSIMFFISNQRINRSTAYFLTCRPVLVKLVFYFQSEHKAVDRP